jgi:DNA-binding CsgD family transcriptional regulator
MATRVSRLRHDGEEYLVLSYPLARPGCLAELTAAELAAIEGVLEARPRRAIARDRGISERTLAKQLSHAYRKLGISSRAELLALVARHRR